MRSPSIPFPQNPFFTPKRRLFGRSLRCEQRKKVYEEGSIPLTACCASQSRIADRTSSGVRQDWIFRRKWRFRETRARIPRIRIWSVGRFRGREHQEDVLHRLFEGGVRHPLAGDPHGDDGLFQVLDARVGERDPLVEERRPLLLPLQDQAEDRRGVPDSSPPDRGVHQGAQCDLLPDRLVPNHDVPGARSGCSGPAASKREKMILRRFAREALRVPPSPESAAGAPPLPPACRGRRRSSPSRRGSAGPPCCAPPSIASRRGGGSGCPQRWSRPGIPGRSGGWCPRCPPPCT